jgi:hypothetical protein
LQRYPPLSVVKQGYHILEDDPELHALMVRPVQNCLRPCLPTQKTPQRSECFINQKTPSIKPKILHREMRGQAKASERAEQENAQAGQTLDRLDTMATAHRKSRQCIDCWSPYKTVLQVTPGVKKLIGKDRDDAFLPLFQLPQRDFHGDWQRPVAHLYLEVRLIG